MIYGRSVGNQALVVDLVAAVMIALSLPFSGVLLHGSDFDLGRSFKSSQRTALL